MNRGSTASPRITNPHLTPKSLNHHELDSNCRLPLSAHGFFSFIAAAIFAGDPMCAAADAPKSPEPISLFNGQNLSGWSVYIDHQPAGTDSSQIFQVSDGVIHVYGSPTAGSAQPFGYIATERNAIHITD